MNDRDYPIPSYATYVWLAGNHLYVCFPPTVGSKSHTVLFPATDKGVALFLSVMRERKAGELHIGTKGEPTQYQVERALVSDKKYSEWLRIMNGTFDQEIEDIINEGV